jgi:HPt (histidine-containing phosphotransfer) domain-containing protein
MSQSGPGFPSDAELQQALEQFRSQFTEALPGRMAQVRDCLQACREAPADGQRLRDLHRVLHRLAGAAGTFGRPYLGAACRAIEAQIEELMGRAACTREDLDAIAEAIDALP